MLVSFIIPAYNVENYIPKTLNSLLEQTNKSFEIIIVNDGSTDNTYNVTRNILENSGFQNYKIVNKQNGGVSSARNVGIKEARGKYIIFLDGDDYVAPNLVEKVIKVAQTENVDMVLWKYLDVDENGSVLLDPFNKCDLKEGLIYNGLHILRRIVLDRDFWIWTGGAAYLRERITEHRLVFNEKHKVGEDIEFYFKYIIKARRIYFISDFLAYYVYRNRSAARDFNLRHFDAYLALMEVYKDMLHIFDNVVERNKKSSIEPLLQGIKEQAIFSFLSRFLQFSVYTTSYENAIHHLENSYHGIISDVLKNARKIRKIVSKRSLVERTAFRLYCVSPKLFYHFSRMLYKVGGLK